MSIHSQHVHAHTHTYKVSLAPTHSSLPPSIQRSSGLVWTLVGHWSNVFTLKPKRRERRMGSMLAVEEEEEGTRMARQ